MEVEQTVEDFVHILFPYQRGGLSQLSYSLWSSKFICFGRGEIICFFYKLDLLNYKNNGMHLSNVLITVCL